MHLAQELVDYIIDFLHDDPTSLIQLSLVSRAWVSRARVHRWETMKIIGQELTFSNLSYLPPLCGYVKVLRFRWPTGSVQASTALDCFEQSTLHTLIIFSREFYLLDEQTIRRCFAKFPCGSITTLQLHDISPIHRNLIVLLSLFPNADNLSISVSRYWGTAPNPDRLGNHDKEIAQCTSPHRFRGSFKLSDPPCNVFGGCRRSKLLRTIAVFPLQFQTVSLDTAEYERGETSIFLKSCSKTARKLFVRLGPRKYQPWVSFHTAAGAQIVHFWQEIGSIGRPLISRTSRSYVSAYHVV